MLKAVLLMLVCGIAHAGNLPDKNLTPGVAREVTLQELCSTSTKLVRHTTGATKKEVYAEYQLAAKSSPECSGVGYACYEIDHLIALTDGGADVKENLWPELYDGACNAHLKDKLEVKLHSLICGGKISMQAAQAAISTNWIAAYTQYVDPKGCQ